MNSLSRKRKVTKTRVIIVLSRRFWELYKLGKGVRMAICCSIDKCQLRFVVWLSCLFWSGVIYLFFPHISSIGLQSEKDWASVGCWWDQYLWCVLVYSKCVCPWLQARYDRLEAKPQSLSGLCWVPGGIHSSKSTAGRHLRKTQRWMTEKLPNVFERIHGDMGFEISARMDGWR